MASLKRVFTGGARSGAAGTGFRGKSNPPASSGSSTGGAGQGLVGDRAKTIVALEAKVNNGTATKAEIAELKKLETANEEATTRARVRASETRRDRKGVMPTKTEQPKDAVATYMKTGEKLEGFTPTPRQVEQRKRMLLLVEQQIKKLAVKLFIVLMEGALEVVRVFLRRVRKLVEQRQSLIQEEALLIQKQVLLVEQVCLILLAVNKRKWAAVK
jgi:hypothetical protein